MILRIRDDRYKQLMSNPDYKPKLADRIQSEPLPGKVFEIPKIPPAVHNLEELRLALKRKWQLPAQNLGQLLIALQIVSADEIHRAILTQKQHVGTYLGEILIGQGAATEDEVKSTLAYKLGLPFVKLDSFDIDPKALNSIPRDLAARCHMIPLLLYDGKLVVAMSDATDFDAIQMAEFSTGLHIESTVSSQQEIESAIFKNFGSHDEDEVFKHLPEIGIDSEITDHKYLKEAERLSKEKPIVKLVYNMITEAVHGKASDIHIRPGDKKVDLIYRIDGTLINIRKLSKRIHAAVVSRIKIFGGMDISERRIPQDGRANINIGGNLIDLRISIMPTINGESVVIRILDTQAGMRHINGLGLSQKDYVVFRNMLNQSYGILLVTGPTGSGKSTTLYAALEYIRKSNVNIITAEDPVEYHMHGIEQMQVNHKIGYSFARILRNILRHDPDVIMVGEIRDAETAKVAVESALTGHLVLSTLHTNSAAVTVTRLLEMGVEPYLINDTLLGVLAQRLIRLNCPECVEVEHVEGIVYDALGISNSEQFYRGKGCSQCNNTGYHKRMAVYELLQMTPGLRAMLLKQSGAEAVQAEAVAQGMVQLTDNALKIARNKQTSLAEVYRVRLS